MFNKKEKERIDTTSQITFRYPTRNASLNAGADLNCCRPNRIGYMRDKRRFIEAMVEVEEKGFKHLMKDGVWLVPIAERPMNWVWMGGRER